jgi:hypothetical protein
MSIYKTDEEIEALLEHPNNGLKKINVEVKIIGSGNHGNQSEEGKNAGNQRRELETKVNIGTLAHLIGGKSTSELTGISESQISKYKNGKNSSNVVKSEIVEAIDERLGNVSKKALDRVEVLMDLFVEDKMNELKAGEIPSAAEKLVSIFEKVNKSNDKNGNNASKPTVVIYAPRQLNINEYITKEV